MHKLNERGSVVSIIMIVFSVIALIGLAGFGGWAYVSRQDYKDNSDAKVAEAVAATITDEQAKKDAEFIEREKQPYDTYTTPGQLGSVRIMYPKTWSAYVDETGQSGTPIAGFFYPAFVPNTTSRDTTFPLKVVIKNSTFEQEMKLLESFVASGSMKVSPYRAPLVDSILGSRVDGKISPGNDKVEGAMIYIPLRDKTLILTTESTKYIPDFESAVLANLTFVP